MTAHLGAILAAVLGPAVPLLMWWLEWRKAASARETAGGDLDLRRHEQTVSEWEELTNTYKRLAEELALRLKRCENRCEQLTALMRSANMAVPPWPDEELK